MNHRRTFDYKVTIPCIFDGTNTSTLFSRRRKEKGFACDIFVLVVELKLKLKLKLKIGFYFRSLEKMICDGMGGVAFIIFVDS